jgi:hypothetical protein
LQTISSSYLTSYRRKGETRMNCSDCNELHKEQKREAPCDSCPIGWFMREAEAMKASPVPNKMVKK